MHRLALELDGLCKSYDDNELFNNFNLTVEVGERVAVIGQNGIGKTTLLKCLAGDIQPTAGTVKWSENSEIGYCAQDHAAEFQDDKLLFDWMEQWRQPSDDDQVIRSTLGRLLFSQDDIGKRVSVLSGGEKGRMIFGKLML